MRGPGFYSFVVYKLSAALTGLFLILFLVFHLYGNFYLLEGPMVYNWKARELLVNPLIRVVEVLLVIAFVVHIVSGVVLTARNWSGRGERYRYVFWQTAFFKRLMWLSGAVILLFLVVHLGTFTVPYRITGEVQDLYQAVAKAFANPWYTLFYVLAFVFLGFHLAHAWESAFQTLGVFHRVWTPVLRSIGYFLAVAIPLGYIFLALYMFFKANPEWLRALPFLSGVS